MKLPSFQFYPESWTGDKDLRRCSWAARGAWIACLCDMHDSSEYGVLRFPLREIATMTGAPLPLLRELAEKGVLSGTDSKFDGYWHTPTHGRVKGPPVLLVAGSDGPVWFSRRMVRDEWRRQRAGASTRFGPGGEQPDRHSPTRRDGERQGESPNSTPSARRSDGAMVLGSVSINGVVDGNADARGRQPKNRSGDRSPGTSKPPAGWHKSEKGILAMGTYLGLPAQRGESTTAYKDRLFAAIHTGKATH